MAYEGTVHAERLTRCAFSAAQSYAEDFLTAPEHAVLSAGILRRRVVFRFGTHVDTLEDGRAHEEIVLRWSAGSAFLPDFSGTLRLRIALPGTLLVLEGRYVPPFGALGALFDRVAGRRLALASAASFLLRLDETLAARERAWRDGQALSAVAAES